MSGLRTVIIGAGPAGLVTALGLARHGRRATVIDRDPDQPLSAPADAYETWSRPGVPQSAQPHNVLARARRALQRHAPDVIAEMLTAGAWENDLCTRLVKEAALPGDEDLVAIAIRRPVFECVLRRAVARESLVSLVPGSAVTSVELRRQEGGPPRVVGVTTEGSTIDADVVVDAAGRHSLVRGWLRDAGVSTGSALASECGILYYSRYFRLLPGAPHPAWTGALGPAGTTDCVRFSTFFGDNRTFAIVLGVSSREPAFRALRRPDLYMGVIGRFRSLAGLVTPEIAQPITDVMPMGALTNVLHPPLMEGRPVALGLHFVGDSYCHTNPLFAWGLCLGVDHGFELARIIDEHPRDPEAQALAFAATTQAETEQCYRAVAEEDHDRTLTWRGEPPGGPFLGKTFAGFVRQCALPAILEDGEVARAVLRRSNLLDPPDALPRDSATIAHIIEVRRRSPQPAPGAFPSREELLELIEQQPGAERDRMSGIRPRPLGSRREGARPA